MIRIAIVEDEKSCADLLKSYIKRYGLENSVSFSITHIPSGIDFLSDYRPVYDIIFMDIKMPHMDGMKTAQKLRTMDSSVALIFVTNLRQYAIKGYEVNALDFIVKPVEYYDFKMKLIKAIESMQRNQQDSLVIDSNGVMVKVLLSELYYVEVISHKLIYHTSRGNFETSGQLAKVESALAEKFFTRCDYSYLVNLRHVTEAGLDFIIVGGTSLPISRRRKKGFMNLLSAYLGGGMV